MTIGWRHAVITGLSVLDVRQLLERGTRRDYVIASHSETGREHVHVVYYETSGSYGLGGLVRRRSSRATYSSRRLRCYNCALQYLHSRGRKVRFSFTALVTLIRTGGLHASGRASLSNLAPSLPTSH